MNILQRIGAAFAAIGLAVTAFAAGPTWHHDGKFLYLGEGDEQWKIAVNTSAAGPLTISGDSIKACPATPDYTESNGKGTYLLDFSGAIDDGSYIVGFGAYSFRICNSPYVYLHKVVFPDTLQSIPGGAANLFGSQGYLAEISPVFPVSLKTYGNKMFQGPKTQRYDIFCLNDSFASMPQQGINDWRGTNIFFGVGFTSFGGYFFQSRGGTPTRFYFFGDVPTTYDGNFSQQAGCAGNGMLLCYPEGNASWKAYIAANARTPTESEISATQKYFPDVTATAIFTNGVWKNVGNKARAVAWDPWSEMDWFQVKGSSGPIGTGANLVKPEYGPQLRSQLDASVTCTAPATKQTYEGNDYVFKGYVVEKYAGNGTWTKVAEGEGNSYTFANSTIGSGSYRLVWQWQLDARYQLNWHSDLIPEGGVTVTASPEPDDEGLYAMGTVVTLTATDGENADWGAFGAWVGDVGNDRRWTDSRSISITMDGHKSVYAEQVWSYASSKLTDGYHTLNVTATGKKISLNMDGATATPKYPMLDLRKKIAGGYTLTSIAWYGLRNSTFSSLFLPDTLTYIGGEQYMYVYSYVYPAIPHNVASIGDRCMKGLQYAGPVRLMNEAITYVPEQIFYEGAVSGFVFGQGVTLIGQHLFQGLTSSARTLKFCGGCPRVRAWNNGASDGQLRLFVDPVHNESWADYIASSAREATDAEKTAYTKKFGDDGTVPSYVTTNAMPRYESESGVWGNKQYLVLWNPNTDDTGLFIEGSPKNYTATVSPYYGGHYDYAIGETVTCTAPAVTTDDDGSEVTCTGYVVEQANADGTWSEVSRGDGTSVSFTQAKGYHRVVWQWKKGAVEVKIGAVPYPETDSVTISPVQEKYYPGDTITVTAVGDTFSRWYGDVPAGHEYDRSFTVTLEDAVSFNPYFAHPWVAVEGYATSRMTDGYWTLKISQKADGEVTIVQDCMKATEIKQPTTNLVTVLDLRKPISGGRTLVAVNDYAFRYSDDNTKQVLFRQLRLAETVRYIGTNAFAGHPFEDIEGCLPAALTSLGGRAFASTCTYDGTLALTNKAFTTFPGQLFSMGGRVSKIILGTGVTKICSYAFDNQKGNFDIYFNGNVPKFEDTGWFRGVSDQRLFVPSERWGLHADWTDFIATNCTAITDAQLTSYATKYGEEAPKPVAKFSGQYVVLFESPYDKPRKFTVILR